MAQNEFAGFLEGLPDQRTGGEFDSFLPGEESAPAEPSANPVVNAGRGLGAGVVGLGTGAAGLAEAVGDGVPSTFEAGLSRVGRGWLGLLGIKDSAEAQQVRNDAFAAASPERQALISKIRERIAGGSAPAPEGWRADLSAWGKETQEGLKKTAETNFPAPHPDFLGAWEEGDGVLETAGNLANQASYTLASFIPIAAEYAVANKLGGMAATRGMTDKKILQGAVTAAEVGVAPKYAGIERALANVQAARAKGATAAATGLGTADISGRMYGEQKRAGEEWDAKMEELLAARERGDPNPELERFFALNPERPTADLAANLPYALGAGRLMARGLRPFEGKTQGVLSRAGQNALIFPAAASLEMAGNEQAAGWDEESLGKVLDPRALGEEVISGGLLSLAHSGVSKIGEKGREGQVGLVETLQKQKEARASAEADAAIARAIAEKANDPTVAGNKSYLQIAAEKKQAENRAAAAAAIRAEQGAPAPDAKRLDELKVEAVRAPTPDEDLAKIARPDVLYVRPEELGGEAVGRETTMERLVRDRWEQQKAAREQRELARKKEAETLSQPRILYAGPPEGEAGISPTFDSLPLADIRPEGGLGVGKDSFARKGRKEAIAQEEVFGQQRKEEGVLDKEEEKRFGEKWEENRPLEEGRNGLPLSPIREQDVGLIGMGEKERTAIEQSRPLEGEGELNDLQDLKTWRRLAAGENDTFIPEAEKNPAMRDVPAGIQRALAERELQRTLAQAEEGRRIEEEQRNRAAVRDGIVEGSEVPRSSDIGFPKVEGVRVGTAPREEVRAQDAERAAEKQAGETRGMRILREELSPGDSQIEAFAKNLKDRREAENPRWDNATEEERGRLIENTRVGGDRAKFPFRAKARRWSSFGPEQQAALKAAMEGTEGGIATREEAAALGNFGYEGKDGMGDQWAVENPPTGRAPIDGRPELTRNESMRKLVDGEVLPVDRRMLESQSNSPTEREPIGKKALREELAPKLGGTAAIARMERNGFLQLHSATEEARPTGQQGWTVDGKGVVHVWDTANFPEAVVGHEATHVADAEELGGGWRQLTRDIDKQAKAGDARAQAAIDAALKGMDPKEFVKLSSAEKVHLLNREALAYYIENATAAERAKPTGLLRRIAGEAKAGLRTSEVGQALAKRGIAFKLTDAEALGLARRMVKTGGKIKEWLDAPAKEALQEKIGPMNRNRNLLQQKTGEAKREEPDVTWKLMKQVRDELEAVRVPREAETFEEMEAREKKEFVLWRKLELLQRMRDAESNGDGDGDGPGPKGGGRRIESRAPTEKKIRAASVRPENNERGYASNESVSSSYKRLTGDDDVTFDAPELEGALFIEGMHRGRDGMTGRASELLKAYTDFADKNGERLALMPAASGDLKQKDLIAWYERNGFERLDNGVMVRKPKGERRVESLARPEPAGERKIESLMQETEESSSENVLESRVVDPEKVSALDKEETPQLREELEKQGVRIAPKGTKGEEVYYKEEGKFAESANVLESRARTISFESGTDKEVKVQTDQEKSEVFRKELAEKIAQQGNGPYRYASADLRVGGEGMRAFYDKMLPNEVNKWAKKFGGKVKRTTVVTNPEYKPEEAKEAGADALKQYGEGQDAWMIDLTSGIKAEAEKGMTLYSKAPGDNEVPSWMRELVGEEAPSAHVTETRKMVAGTAGKKIGEKAMDLLWRRPWTPGGLLGKYGPEAHPAFRRYQALEGRDNTVEENVLKAYDKAVRKAWGEKGRELGSAHQAEVLSALGDKGAAAALENLPEDMKPAVVAMREDMDRRSQQFLNEERRLADLFDEDVKRMKEQLPRLSGPAAGELEQMIKVAEAKAWSQRQHAKTIEANLGKWLHTSYEMFGQKGWGDRVKKEQPEVYEAAVAELVAEGRTPAEAKNWLENLFTWGEEAGSFSEGMKRGALPGKVDVTALLKKDKIPEAIQKVMGIHTDPRMVYAQSVQNVGRMANSLSFQLEIRDAGLRMGWLQHPDVLEGRPEGKYVTLSGGRAMAALDGLQAFKEVDTGLKDLVTLYDWGKAMQWIIKLGQTMKFAKTVGSPLPTGAVNAASDILAMVTTGDIANGGLIRNFARTNAGNEKFRAHMAMLGLSSESPFAGAMRDFAKESYFEDLIGEPRSGRALDSTRRGLGIARDKLLEMYNYASDAAKRVGWEAQRAGLEEAEGAKLKARYEGEAEAKEWKDPIYGTVRLVEGEKGWWFENAYGRNVRMDGKTWRTEREARAEAVETLSDWHLDNWAAQRTSDTYMTYSMAGRGAKELARAPLIGGFTGYASEQLRTGVNQFRIMREDYKAGRTALAYKRAMGVVATTAGLHILQSMIMQELGVTDDERLAFQETRPVYDRNSLWIPIGPDDRGDMQWVNAGRYDIYNGLKGMTTGALNRGIEKAPEAMVEGVVQYGLQFFGFDILGSKVKEALENRGGKIYNTEVDGRLLAGVKFVEHVVSGLYPTMAERGVDLTEAFGADKDAATGKDAGPGMAALAMIGAKPATADAYSMLALAVSDLTTRRAMQVGEMSRRLANPNEMDESTVRDIYERVRRARENSFNDLIEKIDLARKMGMGDVEIRRQLRKLEGIKQVDLIAVMGGRVPRWRPDSREFLSGMKKRAETRRFGEEERRRIEERRRKVMGWIRSEAMP